MSRTTTGTVLSVQAVPLGSVLNAAASTSDLTITVQDATDFDSESGGSLAIGGTVYQYASADDDTGIVTLTGTGLSAGAADGDRVDVWNVARNAAAVEYRALVELPGDVNNADSIDARIALPLVLQLPEGQRDPGEGEAVVLTTQDDEWVVTDLPGSDPTVGSTLMPTIETSDFIIDTGGGRVLMYTPVSTTLGIDDTTPGTRTYTVPAGVTLVKRECWGGGGAGDSIGTTGWGGGGGAYACDSFYEVLPAQIISYTVGAGGAGTAGVRGAAGGSSTVDSGLVAGGGNGAAGGFATVPPGGTGYRGGSALLARGGGSSACPTGQGASSTGNAGASSAGTDSGAGGDAGTTGTAGSAPGGGGGSSTDTSHAGGAGGVGRVRISYYNAAPLVASIAAAAGFDPVNGQAYPAGVMIYPNTVTDWNTITTPGTYIGIASAQTNSPGDTKTWVGETYGRIETGTLVQIVNRLSTGDFPETWTRQYSTTNGWQPWHQIGGNPNWQAITPASGYTGVSWQVCKYNGEVKIQGHVNKTSGSFSTSTTTVGTLPSSDFAPAVAVRASCQGDGSTGSGGGALIIAAGSTTVQIQAASGSSWGAVYTFDGWPTV